MDKRLDLSRDELRPIADRYFPPVALIVRGDEIPEELTDRLLEERWQVKTCHGPEHIHCPMVDGRPCALRGSADAAIVFIGTDWDARDALTHRLHCAGDRSSRSILAIEDADDEPRRLHHVTLVGGRSTDAIVEEANWIMDRCDDRL